VSKNSFPVITHIDIFFSLELPRGEMNNFDFPEGRRKGKVKKSQMNKNTSKCGTKQNIVFSGSFHYSNLQNIRFKRE
jgi:hypothetical protein